MSTRASISKVNEDGSITAVYCHSDGYPSWVGKILRNHYATQDRVDALLSNGNISVLGRKCDGEEGHSFNTPKENQTVYYGRDRGEKGEEATTAKNDKEFENQWKEAWCAYFYQYRDGQWYVGESENDINAELTPIMVADD